MQGSFKESQMSEMSENDISNFKRRQGKLKYLNITKDITDFKVSLILSILTNFVHNILILLDGRITYFLKFCLSNLCVNR